MGTVWVSFEYLNRSYYSTARLHGLRYRADNLSPQVTAPISFGALLQLPKDQLRELVGKQPSLKAGLRDYVTKKATNKARVAGFLDIFGDGEAAANGNGTMQTPTPTSAPGTPQTPVEATPSTPALAETGGTPVPQTPLTPLTPTTPATPQMEGIESTS